MITNRVHPSINLKMVRFQLKNFDSPIPQEYHNSWSFSVTFISLSSCYLSPNFLLPYPLPFFTFFSCSFLLLFDSFRKVRLPFCTSDLMNLFPMATHSLTNTHRDIYIRDPKAAKAKHWKGKESENDYKSRHHRRWELEEEVGDERWKMIRRVLEERERREVSLRMGYPVLSSTRSFCREWKREKGYQHCPKVTACVDGIAMANWFVRGAQIGQLRRRPEGDRTA